MPQRLRHYTRVAVAQLAYHPAAVIHGRSPLEDPLFEFSKPDQPPKLDSLLPESGEAPARFRSRLDQLRRRIRETYDEQLLDRIKIILSACQAWQAHLIVFPEYSIPSEILGGVADAAGEMVVIAGTHAVTRAARQSGVYQKLGAAELPDDGMAVCPVLYRGRLLGLQAKLNPAVPEQDSLVPGGRWLPVELPKTMPGPCGVMICLDFLYREGPRHRGLVSEALPDCRFLAVPSLTPHYTLGEFAGKAWEEARRYGRPVLYADIASGGGTSIYVDEGAPADLRRFPDQAGYLDRDDEGVIVADVDLGYERVGRSTRYDASRPIRPVAAASFVYRAHAIGEQYATFLDRLTPWIDGPGAGVDAAVRLLEAESDLVLNAGAGSGAEVRGRRLRRLMNDLAYVGRAEELKRYTREVVMPPRLLPLADLRAALAKGAAEVVFGWLREQRGVGWEAVEHRLREAGQRVATPNRAEWTDEGVRAIALVGEALQDPLEAQTTGTAPVQPDVRVVLPRDLNPAMLGQRVVDGMVVQFRADPEQFDWRQFQNAGPDYPKPSGELTWTIPLSYTNEIFLLLRGEGVDRLVALAFRSVQWFRSYAVVAAERGNRWVVHGFPPNWNWLEQQGTIELLRQLGLPNVDVESLSEEARDARAIRFLSRFEGAWPTIEQLRDQRLRDVRGKFVWPHVGVGRGTELRPAGEALDAWLESETQTALVLGELGSGKSTLLAEWAHGRWVEHSDGPRPILCSLAGAGPSADAEVLLLQASGVPDTPANRAALLLLIRRRRILPIFDGFDEMATRLTPADLAGRLAELLRVARGGGQVVVSSRDHYFPTEDRLRTVTEQALAGTLGQSSGLHRLTVQPFDQRQIREFVTAVRGPAAVEETLDRFARLYPLQELVSRPLLLGMVLQTLDSLRPTDRISRAEIFEKYLQRWLEQTHYQEAFSDEQKAALAEALADQLWRSGQPSCSPEELQQSVRALLLPALPDDLSPGAAFLEIFGGSFFVRETDDRYRFAHKSFQEFFLARSLVRTLPERPAQVLSTPRPITPEVASFVGELLGREGDPSRSPAVLATRNWLSQGRRAEAASAEAVRVTADAAANAVRLLLGLSNWAGEATTWVPEQADLRGVRMPGADLRGASLVGADLTGAELSGADLSLADLRGAELTGARLLGACFNEANLSLVRALGSDCTQAQASRARLNRVDFSGAVLRQSCWMDCDWRQVEVAGADLTGCLAPAGPSPSGTVPSGALPVIAGGHGGSILTLAFQPRGSWLATGGIDGTVRLWDVVTGRELGCFAGPEGDVTALAWDPTGKRVAATGDDGVVRVWDALTGLEVAALQPPDKPTPSRSFFWSALAWSPDGQRLASTGDDPWVRLWDAQIGTEVSRLESQELRVFTVAWSPDGSLLAGAGMKGNVRVWDAATGRLVCLFEKDEDSSFVWAVAWHPGGAELASSDTEGRVRIWNTLSMELTRLEGHTGNVRALAWHPDGIRLATAGDDRTVRLWDTRARKELLRLQVHQGSARALAWHPDGVHLISGGHHAAVRVWDTATGNEVASAEGAEEGEFALAWQPGGNWLASAGADGTARVWDASTGKQVSWLAAPAGSLCSLAWHPDGTRLAGGSSAGAVVLWDVAGQEELARLDGPQGDKTVLALAWAREGRRLMHAHQDGTVGEWTDPSFGGDESSADRALSRIGSVLTLTSSMALAWSSDRERLAYPTLQHTVKVANARTGEDLRTSPRHADEVLAIAWHPDGKCVASADATGVVCLWEEVTGTEVARFSAAGPPPLALAWHPGGRILAGAGKDGRVWLWDTATGQEQGRLASDGALISRLAWEPNGRRLAGAGGRTIWIWDPSQGRVLCVLEWDGANALARTPVGFCVIGGGPDRYRLALRRPERPATRLYVPLGGVREVLEQPGRVRAALAGDLSDDDLQLELNQRGWTSGEPWDGRFSRGPALVSEEGPPSVVESVPARRDEVTMAKRIPDEGPPRMVESAPAPAPAAPEVPLFLPGRALTESDTLPGREAVIQELLALIESRSPAILRGPRRSGKTSIFHALAHRLHGRRSVRRVTLEGAALGNRDELARCLEAQVVGEASPSQALLNRLQKEDRPVLLLDEVAHLGHTDHEGLNWLRSVGQEYASLVFAGSHWDWHQVVLHAVKGPGSSFGNDVTPVDLGPIGEKEAIDFLVGTAAKQGVGMAAERTAAWIVSLCGPWPFYLQVMGYAVVQAARAGKRRALAEREGVFDLYLTRLLRGRDPVFRGRWEELPALVRDLLANVPDGRMPSYWQLPSLLRPLLRATGLCVEDGTWLDDRPFYDWVRRNAADLREASHGDLQRDAQGL